MSQTTDLNNRKESESSIKGNEDSIIVNKKSTGQSKKNTNNNSTYSSKITGSINNSTMESTVRLCLDSCLAYGLDRFQHLAPAYAAAYPAGQQERWDTLRR